MKLGISTSSFFNRINTESSFDIIRQMHIDNLLVSLTTFSEYERRFVDALIPRKGNLGVLAVRPEGGQFEPELFSTNARVRADAEVFFKKVCAACQTLGARYYVFTGPVRLKRRNYEFDFVRLGDRINQLCEIARSFGIVLCYQNLFYSYANEPDFFRNIIKHCPPLMCALDLKHAALSGIEPIKFIEAFADRTAIIQLCDMKKDLTTALPGEGKFNFDKFFAELLKRKVSANLMLEANSRDYQDLNALKSSYDYIAALWMRAKG